MNSALLAFVRRPVVVGLMAILASAVLLGVYARGGAAFALGFVALVPWLIGLNRTRGYLGATLAGLGMTVAFVAAVFAWFGAAADAYTGIGAVPASLLLCALAPLLQPQVVVFALVRHGVGRRHGAALRALAGAAAWAATEALWPKLLGDTLGHGLLPAAHLRQVADLGGAAGLTVLLLLSNEALVLAIERRRAGWRALRAPVLLALALPLAMSAYGAMRLAALRVVLAEPVPALRLGLVQSGIVDYERLRAERGTYAVARDVLDTHFALSRAAIEHHGAEALLWSETVYPTTFAQPRSADGAALDREILDFSAEHGVPLVFGTYDVDGNGEYNAAAFVEPQAGLIGFYRKTHPFPLTEYVPRWLDGPTLRRWLPWAGTWQRGHGARVLPLRSADGREINVVPLICLDDVDPSLALDGARLGAQAIVGLSNDSWFTTQPLGARLHLAVAAFRSIETRLPQLRVTNNGLSAMIDPSGEIIASTAMGDRAVLAGEIPLRDPPPTLMLRWGDWVGRAGLVFLLVLGAMQAWRRWRVGRAERSTPVSTPPATTLAAEWVVLTPIWRVACALLKLLAGLGLIWLAARVLWVDGLQVNSLAPLRIFVVCVAAPACAVWLIGRAFATRASIDAQHLQLQQRGRRIEIPLQRIALLRPWRLPLPGPGVDLILASGRRWEGGLTQVDPRGLQRALAAAGSPLQIEPASFALDYAALRASAARHRLDHVWIKFVLFPLLLSLPAFRLHQHIAYGGSFGELYTYGASAWFSGLLIWWAAWALALTLLASVLRVAIESVSLLTLRLKPALAPGLRQRFEIGGRVIYYLGLPLWLAGRLLSG